MSKVKDFFDPGDYLVEYNQVYLGCAKVEITLLPEGMEIRRDSWTLLKKRQVQSVQWHVAASLRNSERLWALLGGRENLTQKEFTESLFADGCCLKLYPADPRQRGFEFLRAYLTEVRQISGGDLTVGALNLQFICAADLHTQCYFKRLPEQSRPDAVPLRTTPDVADISRELIRLLAEPLAAVPEQTLRLNFFDHNGEGAYVLTLERCQSWNDRAPHTLEYVLTARFPISFKSRCDQYLLNTADILNDYHLKIGTHDTLLCRAHSVDFSGRKLVAGKTMCNSVLNFSVVTA